MITQELENILQCPECQNRDLIYTENQINCPGCSTWFDVDSGIPVMLVENITVSRESEIHKTFGSTFNYIGHYQKDALEYDYFQKQTGATGHNERRVREYIGWQLPKKKGLILDVGCGNAWVAKTFLPKGYEVVSFDISFKNTLEALTRYNFENHFAVVGDVFSLPFQDNKFDYIIASEIIEHVTEPGKFIKNLFRVLKTGGTLIVTTPYKEEITYSLCVHCNKPTPKSAHLHSFDEKILFSLYDGDDLAWVKFLKFGNKALIHLRTHVLLRFFGFRLWKLADKIANGLYNRPLSILVKWEKKGN